VRSPGISGAGMALNRRMPHLDVLLRFDRPRSWLNIRLSAHDRNIVKLTNEQLKESSPTLAGSIAQAWPTRCGSFLRRRLPVSEFHGSTNKMTVTAARRPRNGFSCAGFHPGRGSCSISSAHLIQARLLARRSTVRDANPHHENPFLGVLRRSRHLVGRSRGTSENCNLLRRNDPQRVGQAWGNGASQRWLLSLSCSFVNFTMLRSCADQRILSMIWAVNLNRTSRWRHATI